MLDYWSLHSLLVGLDVIGTDCQSHKLLTVTIDTRVFAQNFLLNETKGKTKSEIQKLDSIAVHSATNERLTILEIVKELASFFEASEQTFSTGRSLFLEGIRNAVRGNTSWFGVCKNSSLHHSPSSFGSETRSPKSPNVGNPTSFTSTAVLSARGCESHGGFAFLSQISLPPQRGHSLKVSWPKKLR